MRSISRLTMTALATGGLALVSAFPAPAAVIGTGSEPVDVHVLGRVLHRSGRNGLRPRRARPRHLVVP